jgi:hypothetical protein
VDGMKIINGMLNIVFAVYFAVRAYDGEIVNNDVYFLCGLVFIDGLTMVIRGK